MPVQTMPGAIEPKDPYLALHTGGGALLAIPRGATMFICVPGEHPIPLMLAKVTEKTITFRCMCRQPNCTRVMRYGRTVTGYHPVKYGK